MRALLIFFIILVSPTLKAQVHTVCPGKTIIKIMRPLDHSGKKFEYSFEYNCKDPELPTIIHIPGGPGMTSIGQNLFDDVNANIILTDPRGSGLNSNYWTKGGKKGVLSTEKIADDIIGIITKLKLQRYSIHGHSFGTAVATIATSKMEKNKSHFLPASLILEGVVGKAVRDDQQNEVTREVFNEIKKEADFCVSCKLDSLRGPLTDNQIGNLVETLQSLGKFVAVDYIQHSSAEQLISMAKENTTPMNAAQLRLYDAIACREYFSKGITDTPYLNGELNRPQGGSCKSTKLDRPYDSKKWQIKTKTYYIVGSSDNFTPVDQARYQFENQRSPNKTVLCVPNAGHTPLKYNISSCSKKLLEKMASGSDSEIMEQDLVRCESKVKLNTFSCGK